MENQIHNLKQIVKTIPSVSGCYLYKDNNETVIYVGKAKNLKKRITSYFYQNRDEKTKALVAEILTINYIATTNEKEALLLEHTLIKKYMPKYNVLLKNKKPNPYIKITNEQHPQYQYVRKINNKKGNYYGPFYNSYTALTVLKLLEQAFPLRKCSLTNTEPCLSYQLSYCSGSCFKPVPATYYKTMIHKVNLFFKGNIAETEELLKKRMAICVTNWQFEAANRAKILLQKLQSFHAQQTVQFPDLINRDFINYVIEDKVISIVTLFYRHGKLQTKDEQIVQASDFTNYIDVLTNYIITLYEKNPVPNELYLPETINLSMIKRLFPKVKCFYPQKGTKATIFLNTKNNAIYALKQWQSQASTNN